MSESCDSFLYTHTSNNYKKNVSAIFFITHNLSTPHPSTFLTRPCPKKLSKSLKKQTKTTPKYWTYKQTATYKYNKDNPVLTPMIFHIKEQYTHAIWEGVVPAKSTQGRKSTKCESHHMLTRNHGKKKSAYTSQQWILGWNNIYQIITTGLILSLWCWGSDFFSVAEP